MIFLQTSSGIKGTADTFLAMFLPGSRELQRYGKDHSNKLNHNSLNIILLQKVLSFIQNTVNPIGFEVDDIGAKDSDHFFGDDFVKSPEYILDSDDYF